MYTCEFCKRSFEHQINLSNHRPKCRKNPNRCKQKNFRDLNDIEVLLDDDNKLYSKWLNKRNNSKKEKIPFSLTYYDFCKLVQDANLKSSDLGFSGNGYVLARYGDMGGYEYSNCRFISQLENVRERKVSENARDSARRNIQKFNKNRSDYDYEQHKKHTKHKKDLIIKRLNSCGSKNSQFGTFWITDGVVNKKWKESNGDIPSGFTRGRKLKIGS